MAPPGTNPLYGTLPIEQYRQGAILPLMPPQLQAMLHPQPQPASSAPPASPGEYDLEAQLMSELAALDEQLGTAHAAGTARMHQGPNTSAPYARAPGGVQQQHRGGPAPMHMRHAQPPLMQAATAAAATPQQTSAADIAYLQALMAGLLPPLETLISPQPSTAVQSQPAAVPLGAPRLPHEAAATAAAARAPAAVLPSYAPAGMYAHAQPVHSPPPAQGAGPAQPAAAVTMAMPASSSSQQAPAAQAQAPPPRLSLPSLMPLSPHPSSTSAPQMALQAGAAQAPSPAASAAAPSPAPGAASATTSLPLPSPATMLLGLGYNNIDSAVRSSSLSSSRRGLFTGPAGSSSHAGSSTMPSPGASASQPAAAATPAPVATPATASASGADAAPPGALLQVWEVLQVRE